MADQRYAERTGELKEGVPQPPEQEFLVAPNPGAALWASSAAGAARAGPQGMHYGGAWDQPGSTGSAGFAGTTAAGGLGGRAGAGGPAGPVEGYGAGAVAHGRSGAGGADYGAGLGAGASTLGVLGGRSGEGEPWAEPIGPAGHQGLGGGVSGFDNRGTEGEDALQRVGPGAGRPKLAQAGRAGLAEHTELLEGLGTGGPGAAGLRHIADQIGL